MAADPVEQTIIDIMSKIGDCEAAWSAATTDVAAMHGTTSAIVEDFRSPPGSARALWRSVRAFTLSAGSRAHDIEIVASESWLNEKLRSVSLPPINVTNPLSITLRPAGPPVGSFAAAVSFATPHPNCLLITTRWLVSISGSPEVSMRVVLCLSLKVSGTDTVAFMMALAPIYQQPSGAEYDPFEIIPIAMRAQMRQRVLADIQTSLAAFTFRVPPIATPGFSLFPKPHTFVLSTTFLTLIDRQKPKRRDPVAVLQNIPLGYRQAIHVKREYVEPIIRQKISENPDVTSVTQLEFKPTFIELEIYIEKDGTVPVASWISWEVRVWVIYRLHLYNTSSVTLKVRATQGYWHAETEAHNCWPICDDVLSEVESRLRDELRNTETMTYDFANFGGTALSVNGRFDSYGLLLWLNPV